MLKNITISIKIGLFALIICAVPAVAEQMIVKKITMGHFTVQGDKIFTIKSDPYWPDINRHTLTVDGKGNIYVFNLSHSEIMVFDNSGTLQGKIVLPVESVKMKSNSRAQFEVSIDGERFFVDIPDQGHTWDPGYIKGKKYIVNKKGGIVKQVTKEMYPEFDVKLCNKPYYISLHNSVQYDENFNEVKETFKGFEDSEGRYGILYSKEISAFLLIKYAKNGIKLWEKRFDGDFQIIGTDRDGYLYLNGKLKKGDPNSLYKLDPKGEIIAQATIPNPFPFLTQEEKEENEMRSSEEFFSFIKLACNGDAYLIYQLSELPKLTMQRWQKGGEYFIYKFETTKNNVSCPDPQVLFLANVFKSKKYDGDSRYYDGSEFNLSKYATADTIKITDDVQKMFVKLLRNEIYGRHGRLFFDEMLKEVFSGTVWYKPDPNYSDKMLNDYEKKNVDFILSYEKRRGWR